MSGQRTAKLGNALIVFAKPPIAGLAKTRLIPALGETGAANYHAKLLNHTLDNVISDQEWDTHLWCSENIAHPFFQSCLTRYSLALRVQGQGDLGVRMAHAMRVMLGDYENVCIIGSDCPVLDTEKIRRVFAQLKSKEDVVITPAEDGGYVLMALKRQLDPGIFSGIHSNIQWGGDAVFHDLLQNLKKRKLNPIIQPTLWDIDTPEDLSRLAL